MRPSAWKRSSANFGLGGFRKFRRGNLPSSTADRSGGVRNRMMWQDEGCHLSLPPRTQRKVLGLEGYLEGYEGRVRRYEQEVLGHLRRWLIEEGLETPMGDSGYRLRTEDVRGEVHEGEKVVVVLFRLRVPKLQHHDHPGPPGRSLGGDDRLFGFRVELLDFLDRGGPGAPRDPFFDPPEANAETILALLDEAILVGTRSIPDPEGIVWVS